MSKLHADEKSRLVAPAGRECEPELMDDPQLEPERHISALDGLARINVLSASMRIVWQPIRNLAHRNPGRPLRVLDLATGSGDIPIGLWRCAARHNLQLDIHAVDVSERALEHARQRALAYQAPVEFRVLDAIREDLPTDFDVITCSLFLHHLDSDEAHRLLRRMSEAARKMVVVNDLHRCTTGLVLAYLASRLLTASDVVRVDAVRSVRAAFTKREVRELANDAGLSQAKLKSKWPCRYVLTWEN